MVPLILSADGLLHEPLLYLILHFKQPTNEHCECVRSGIGPLFSAESA